MLRCCSVVHLPSRMSSLQFTGLQNLAVTQVQEPSMLESTNRTMAPIFEQVHVQYDLYLQDLVFHYVQYMQWYKEGSVQTLDFMLETIDDVYNNHLYYISWFYEGALPFDSFEIQYENWLAEQVMEALDEDQASGPPNFTLNTLVKMNSDSS